MRPVAETAHLPLNVRLQRERLAVTVAAADVAAAKAALAKAELKYGEAMYDLNRVIDRAIETLQ